MLHISLFSGIGGFDLAAEWMGWKNIVSCEINDFGNKVLEYYWPNAYHHRDIHTLNYQLINDELTKRYGQEWRSNDIILTGGFPCQPYSVAGKRLGKEDERHLWPEMLRVISEVKPTFVVGENVSGLLSWNGGLVFDEVRADLEAQGYEVAVFVLPAAGVNAPHKRERVWFVAYSYNSGLERGKISGSSGSSRQKQQKQPSGLFRGNRENFPAQSAIFNVNDGISRIMDRNINFEIYASIKKIHGIKNLQKVWECFQSKDVQRKIGRLYKIHDPSLLLKTVQLCSRTYKNPKRISLYSEKTSKGMLRKLSKYGTFANTPQGRKLEKQFTEQFADTLPKLSHEIALVTMEAERASRRFVFWWRNETIKAGGNAIVPQVAFEIFKAIEKTHYSHN